MRHLPRQVVEEIQSFSARHLRKRDWSEPDVETDDPDHQRCGPGLGFCAPGDWYAMEKQSIQILLQTNLSASCSHVGYCGRGYRYCQSPHCQFDYSDSCDSSIKPLGEDTINVPRPLIGNVTYEAEGIHECSVPGTLALTFDDGPYNYTSHVLDALAAYGAKATFFLTGNNLGKGQIDIEENGWPDIIRRMHADGHQVLLVYFCRDWF